MYTFYKVNFFLEFFEYYNMFIELSIILNFILLFDVDVLMKNYSMRYCYYLLYIYLMYINVIVIIEYYFIVFFIFRLK